MPGRPPIRLRSLTIEALEIPFKVSFRHSSAERVATEAVLITADTEDGLKGAGEGCPREYVTGETLDTAHAFFYQHLSDFLKIGAVEDLKSWIASHDKTINQNPAAFCAVELALLYALAKDADQSVERLLSLPELSGEFRYTGVLGVGNRENFRKQLGQYLTLGFTDLKMKICGQTEIDRANITVLKDCGHNDIRVRFDANNLWSNSDEAISYLKELDYPIFALEEPLRSRAYEDCRTVGGALGISIILDESFANLADFESIRLDGSNWIVNIRISKMGGIIRSLCVAEKAQDLGIAVIIGAQVGETSILTRAALTIANSYRNIVIAQEGAFGTHLLEKDICEPSIMFGAGGILQASKVRPYP